MSLLFRDLAQQKYEFLGLASPCSNLKFLSLVKTLESGVLRMWRKKTYQWLKAMEIFRYSLMFHEENCILTCQLKHYTKKYSLKIHLCKTCWSPLI